MALEDILRKIDFDTQLEIKKIATELLSEKNKIESSTQEKIAQIKKDIMNSTIERLNQEKQQLYTSMNIELNKKLLQEKRNIINNVFKESFRTITTTLLNPKSKALIVGLIKKALKSIPSGEIVLSRKYATLVDSLQEELKKSGIKNKISFDDIPEGFIIKEGSRQINCTIEALFRLLKDTIEPELAQVLFPE